MASRNVVAHYRYDPFGAPEPTEGASVSSRIRFHGAWYDTNTGLYYMRNRHYDPSLQRFVSEDPIGLAGGINPYAYVANSPVTYRDPLGLECNVENQSDCPVFKLPGIQVITTRDTVDEGGGRNHPTDGIEIPNRGQPRQPGAPSSGDGDADPNPRETCVQDLIQLAVNGTLHGLGLGAIKSIRAVIRANRATSRSVAALSRGAATSTSSQAVLQAGYDAMATISLTPSAVAVRYHVNQQGGTDLGLTDGWATTYEIGKIVPFVSLGLDAFEAALSCAAAVSR